MKLLSRKKSTSSVRSTAAQSVCSQYRAGASSTSLNLAVTPGAEEETLDDLIQFSERARATAGRRAAEYGVTMPPGLSSQPVPSSDRHRKVREGPAQSGAVTSHLRSPLGRQGSRLRHPADDDTATASSPYSEPPPEYQTWYAPEGVAFRKRWVSKSGIRRTQLRPWPSPIQIDPTPATRLGTTFSSSRINLALPAEREMPPPGPYTHSRMAKSTSELASSPQMRTQIPTRSVAFSAEHRASAPELDGAHPTKSTRPCISGPQALQPRRQCRTLSVATQGSKTPRSAPPSPDRVSTRTHRHVRQTSSSSSSSSTSSRSFPSYARSEFQAPRPLPRKGILKSSASTSAMSTKSRVTFDSSLDSRAVDSKMAKSVSVVKRLFKRDRGG